MTSYTGINYNCPFAVYNFPLYQANAGIFYYFMKKMIPPFMLIIQYYWSQYLNSFLMIGNYFNSDYPKRVKFYMSIAKVHTTKNWKY